MATLKSKTAGFNLLEMLVALLVISVGLLGITSLQLKGQQTNYLSYVRTQATYLASDLMEMIRTNKQSNTGTLYVTNCADTSSSSGSEWSQVAKADLARWCDMIKNSLPEGVGKVTWNSPYYTISIGWQEKEESPDLENCKPPSCNSWTIIPPP